jgi:hypothetical protein
LYIFFYLSLVVDEGDTQIRHGSQDGHQWLYGVAVDNGSILFEIIRCEAALVNNSIWVKLKQISRNLSYEPEFQKNGCVIIDARFA